MYFGKTLLTLSTLAPMVAGEYLHLTHSVERPEAGRYAYVARAHNIGFHMEEGMNTQAPRLPATTLVSSGALDGSVRYVDGGVSLDVSSGYTLFVGSGSVLLSTHASA